MAQPIYDGDPAKFDHLVQNGYDFTLGDYVSRGWEILKQNLGGFILYIFLTMIIGAILGMIPILGQLASLFISPALSAGVYIVARKISLGEHHEFNTFFEGFKDMVQLFLGTLVMGVLIAIGLIFLIVPGIYLAVSYSMTIPLILFERMEFWQAMETSRKVVSKNWGSFFLLFLTYIGIMILGALALGVGIFVAIPLLSCITYVVYEDIFGSGTDMLDDMIDEIGDSEIQAEQINPEDFEEKF